MTEHLFTLVVVTEDHQPLTQLLFGCEDALLARFVILNGKWIACGHRLCLALRRLFCRFFRFWIFAQTDIEFTQLAISGKVGRSGQQAVC